jgi:stage III sporulation protein SpoIIIAA
LSTRAAGHPRKERSIQNLFPHIPGQVVTDDLDDLLHVLPLSLADPLRQMPELAELLEVVMDLGREPEARFPGRETVLSALPVSESDLDYVIQRIGTFGDDNRAGIERTLHRISCIRNREGRIVGLTCRVGRAVFGTIAILRDIVESGKSILMMGKPGVGKTTLLREAARVLADDLKKRVIIVDTSNEIGGDGDIPHPAIGRARRMQVPTPALQHQVMIEAVENHMPEVIVIDEIGTELEALAARTIAERGVQLIATAHGNTLENLMLNPTLSDLVGGIQTVTLGDEEARRRGTQKSILERKAPPTFDVVVEIQSWSRVAVHSNAAEAVDNILRSMPRPPLVRFRDEAGGVRTEVPTPGAALTPLRQLHAAPREGAYADFHERPRRDSRQSALALTAVPSSKPIRIYPYGLNRSRLEQIVRGLQLPVQVSLEPRNADVVLTLKSYYRRKPQALRDAEAVGTPVYVLRNSSGGQLQEGLQRVVQLLDTTPVSSGALAADALQETQEAISHVIETSRSVELSPQSAYIRRLQHQLAEEYGLVSRSYGKEPNRHVKLFAHDE